VADGLAPGQRRVAVTLRRSLIGHAERQRRIVRALGLRRVGHMRVHALTPSLQGALRKIGHLVSVKEVADGPDR